MNTDFCYFCMQLPGFFAGETPSITLEDFDRRLEIVAPAEARYVRHCTYPLTPERSFPRGSAAARLRAFDAALRYEIACFRAAKAGLETPPRPTRLHEVPGQAAEVRAIAGLNPFEREKRLNAFRGVFLDRIAAADPMSREAAACYRLRLAMREWETTFADPSGRDLFRRTVDEIEHQSIGDPAAAPPSGKS